LVDVGGKKGAVAFWHTGAMALNVGVTVGFTVTFIVCADAHGLVGVKT
jgi:hypothetical protein